MLNKNYKKKKSFEKKQTKGTKIFLKKRKKRLKKDQDIYKNHSEVEKKHHHSD